nr:hypothetical protein [Tanacetum cinerariifolium]
MTSGIRASRFEAMANKGDNNVGGASGIMVDENRELKERVEESYQHMEGLESDFVDLREDFKSALNVLGRNVGRDIHDLRGMLLGEIISMRGEIFLTKTLSSVFLMVCKDGPTQSWRDDESKTLLWLLRMHRNLLTLVSGGRANPQMKIVVMSMSVKCFMCDGPHKAQDCPKNEFPIYDGKTKEDPCEDEDAYRESLRVLNAINARNDPPIIEAKNNVRVESPKIEDKSKRETEISTRALVDTGATYNRISVDEAKILGLETVEDSGWIKAVNGDVKPNSGRVCMVEMEKGTKRGAKMMSAMQLKSGFKELKQNTSNISSDLETPRDTKDVLEEVRGTISSVLSKRRAQESCHKDEAKILGLETVEDSGSIKAVNGDAKPNSRVARGVKTNIREWE